MICSNCHKLLNNNQDYCPFCGTAISSSGAVVSKPNAFQKQHQTPDNPQHKICNDENTKKEIDKQKKASRSQSLKPSIILKKEIQAKDEVIPEIKETGNAYIESDRLKDFKSRHNIKEIFRPYKEVKSEDIVENTSTLKFSNTTFRTFVTRINGLGNLFYDEFRIKPFQKKTKVIQNGTYSIRTYIEGSEIVWKSKITDDEEQHYSTSPEDSKFNSDNRTVTLKGGVYYLSCGIF